MHMNMSKKILFFTLSLWLTAVVPVFAGQHQEITATPSESQSSAPYHFALRANLLRWATLTPDLGLEWRVHSSWGILANGSWTSWTWNDNARRYALWEVMPEVRWYLGEKKAWYVGAMFKAGQFNYKFPAAAD